MDISIIVVSYNHGKFISQTLESIVNQNTDYNFEILIGDDCSKDNSLEVILDYQKKYPNIIYNIPRPTNMGATANIYDLICKAKGRYIAFCEGDDFWSDNNRIQEEVEFLDNHKEYSAVCGKTTPVDEDGVGISILNIPDNKRFWIFEKDEYSINDFEQWKMPGHLSAITMRNCFLNSIHDYSIIKSAHKIVADRTIAMIAALNGKVKIREIITSYYRFRIKADGSNFMSSMSVTNYRLDDYIMLRNLEEYSFKEHDIKIVLVGIKNERLVGAVAVWLKEKNELNTGVLKGIINNSGQKPIYILYTLKIIIIKLFYWNILKTDKKISLGGK